MVTLNVVIKNEFSPLLTLRAFGVTHSKSLTSFTIYVSVNRYLISILSIQKHGLLSQITFDWCYQYYSYDWSLDNFSLT